MSSSVIDDRRPVPELEQTRRRRPGRRWAAGVLVVLAVVGLTWVIGFSPVLSVRRVTVRGTHRLTAAAVRASADVTAGQPLIRVRRGAVERRVESLPEVRSAQVSLSFPSTVVITVTERVAAAVRQTSAGSWTFVDATGRSFGALHRAPRDLPQLSPGAAVADDPATLAALAVVAGAVPTGVRARLTRLIASGPTSVVLVLNDGRTVRWGSPDRNADKARLLPALLARHGTEFDISDPDLVYAR